MTKHWGGAKSESEGERKIEKRLKKSSFEKVKIHVLKNLIHDVRLIEKQVRSIEPNRGSLKFLKRISIDRKTDLEKHLFKKITWFLKIHLKALKIRSKNVWEWGEMIFQNTSFKP